jgi:hypothetical protein
MDCHRYCLELGNFSQVNFIIKYSTVLGYRLDDQGSRIQFLAGDGNLSLHHCIQNSYGAHPASYPMGTRGFFPRGKAVRA